MLLLLQPRVERGPALVAAKSFLEVGASVSSQFGLSTEEFATERAGMLADFDLSYYLLYLW